MKSWNLREGDVIAPGRHALRLIGGGFRYEAYLTWDDRLRAVVVTKLVRPDRVEDPDALRGLARERRALERLAHPMLPRLFGAVLEGLRPHLALELVEGPRLSTLIRRFGVNIEQLLPLAVNLCAALHYIAAEGWLHLDVKPRNVIMGPQPRLIDLSVARTVDEARAASGPIGTDAYMAPEQCEPDRFGELSAAADVWGLGVTLYQALTGELPYPRDDRKRFPQLLDDPAPMSESVPKEIASPVMSCLERRPVDRPSAAELADALEPLAAALPAPRIGRFRPGARTLMESLEAR